MYNNDDLTGTIFDFMLFPLKAMSAYSQQLQSPVEPVRPSPPVVSTPEVFTEISLINETTSPKVSDSECAKIVEALNIQLVQFCKDWSLPLHKVVYYTIRSASSIQVLLTTNPDYGIDGALGYHFFDNAINVNIAVVSADRILADSEQGSICKIIAHEIFEMCINPNVTDGWYGMKMYLGDIAIPRPPPGKGQPPPPSDVEEVAPFLVATEVVDPVENNSAPIILKDGSQIISSDYVLPAWFNQNSTQGPYNYLKTLSRPFELSPDGRYSLFQGYAEDPNVLF